MAMVEREEGPPREVFSAEFSAVPQEIVVDITDLELGATIKVADVTLPEGAESAMDPDETVAIALITRSTREAIRRAEQGEAAEGDAGGDEG